MARPWRSRYTHSSPGALIIDAAASGIRYGFRHDPLRWVQTDRSVEAALVRKHIFGHAMPEDEAIIEQLVEGMVSEDGAQRALNSPCPDSIYVLGLLVWRLTDRGLPMEDPRIQMAVDVMMQEIGKLEAPPPDPEKEGMIPFRILCLAGKANHPVVKQWGRDLVERLRGKVAECKEWDQRWQRRAKGLDRSLPRPTPNAPAWPFGIVMEINTLWLTREYTDAVDVVAEALEWVAANLYRADKVPGMAFDEEWNLAMLASDNDHPSAADICVKMLPILMAQQRADGGWARNSICMFRILVKYGLISALAALPPWPHDWRTIRTIPAPGETPLALAADEGKLWVLDLGAGEVIAISPEDGTVLKAIKVPHHRELVAFGAWDGFLWLMPGDESEDQKTIYQVDQNTAEVVSTVEVTGPVHHFATIARIRGKFVIPDQRNGGFWTLDDNGQLLDHEDDDSIHLACPMPDYMAVAGDDIWTLSRVWFSGIMKTNAEGQILDWGEMPFDHRGIAYDDHGLWAIDSKAMRICLIEKSQESQALAFVS